MKCSFFKLASAICIVLVMIASPLLATTTDPHAIDPVPGPHGYFVDTYKTNSYDNMSPETNAVIGVLSPFLDIWAPGDSWDNGQKLGDVGNLLLNQNIQICIDMTNSRTEEQAAPTYLTDRRNQNWSAMDGLGPYETAFKKLSNAGTSLPSEIPAEALTTKFSDKGNENGNWADTDSALGSMVELVNTIRGPHASGNPSKVYYQYMRPFRWDSAVDVLPALRPCISDDPMSDGGFPSGHTNAGYLASLAFAYAVPERFQQLLTNASEIGNYRIIAGMHSPMDVMAGRIMATALAAAALNDPENASLKAQARSQAQEILLKNPGTPETMIYEDESNNDKTYHEHLTYNLPQTGDTTKPMRVPKGAEVLIETRFPYLDATQRRWVLYSTGLPSGYVWMDDAEGWGRLDLYAAANGYGAFNVDVTVSMDASLGSFNAYDVWSNDIYGEGSLTKEGSGTLVLSGNNSYTGGVYVNDGVLAAASSYAFGGSSVNNNATISETVWGPVVISGDYVQSADGTLSLDIDSGNDIFTIIGSASLDGALIVDFSDYPAPESGMVLLSADEITGSFSSIQTIGLSADRAVTLTAEGVVVK